ncbi:serine hydrolase [bacterium]|nr:serine hydrolase [bacterium]
MSAAHPRTTVRRHPIVVLCLLALTFLLSATVSAKTLPEKFDEYCRGANDVLRFHGAVLVAKDGKVIFENGYGWASVQFDVPNTAQTRYLIGSVTKNFTAAAILQLEEQGKLSVDDPISKYLDQFPPEIGDKVTIHHLLTHTSGVHSFTDIADVMARRSMAMTPEEILGTFSHLPLDFEPGSDWKYSNSGYFLLGLIIEKVSDQSYEDYLQEHILGPAGMTNSGYYHGDRIVDKMANGYSIDPDRNLINAPCIDMSLPFSAGALYSTVGDLYLWDRALTTDRILSEASKKKMFTPVKNEYGYGWGITTAVDHPVIQHTGGIDGYSSILQRFYEDDACIVVLTNTDEGTAGRVAMALAAILFDKPYDVPVHKEPVASDESVWPDYVGLYRIDTNDYRMVSLTDGKLFSQRTGTGRIQILPEATDKFFFDHDNSVTLTFVRDDNGTVVKHIIHQQGEDNTAVKLPDNEAAEIMAELFPVEKAVDAAVFQDYVGEYQLAPGFILTVRTRDDRLFTQATGQGEFELYASDTDEYFLRVVEAQISFVRDDAGKVTSLILHQNGRDMPAEKIR